VAQSSGLFDDADFGIVGRGSSVEAFVAAAEAVSRS
jgi:hypothetical protein